MTLNVTAYGLNAFEPAMTIPLGLPVRSTERTNWQSSTASSYSQPGSFVSNRDSILVLFNGAGALAIWGAAKSYSISTTISTSGMVTEMPANHEEWLNKFEDFLSGLPHVGHAVDSSRDRIY